MQTRFNLQDTFLTRARRNRAGGDPLPYERLPAPGGHHRLRLLRGGPHDRGKQQIIYKHAISTIAPVRPVELGEATGEL